MTKEFQSYLRKTTNFEKNFQNMKIISLDKGNCIAEMEVEEGHTNILGTLHGGVTATLIDVVSSYGLASSDKANSAHVSVNLNVRYLKPAKQGEVIIIDAKTVKCGKSLAFLECILKSKETNEIIAKGEHTKYILNSK